MIEQKFFSINKNIYNKKKFDNFLKMYLTF